jgi:squalene-hopene/tetraprenyl-beta-curcumene cyclase
MSAPNPERLRRAATLASEQLLAAIGPDGHWIGELSSSALSTSTAVTALALMDRESGGAHHASCIASGLIWLAQHQNSDGGWGDTVLSLSNLSTTTLCWAAFGAVTGAEERHVAAASKAAAWLKERAGGLEPDRLAPAIIARYGKDRTFSVPILTMCALAGRLGAGREAWKHVIPLPFELAACPHSWFAALRLPVVSYALPALIAIGQVRHHRSPSRNPFARLVRNLTRSSTLKKLTRIQPENGGFLEATPLTSFVTMSLAGGGQCDHPVARRGVEFLVASQRADGSWPIDTNLATWVTTLAVNALGDGGLGVPKAARVKRWLLGQQYRTTHPYTHAAPGGWAWTDLPGGVPDADDTAGALLALRKLGPIDDETRAAAIAGVTWLLGLQNRDGGIPTFCRGWGALPFDQSSADITAHVVRAWSTWLDQLPNHLRRRVNVSAKSAMKYLNTTQRQDGSWKPLWFGNQHSIDDTNLTYGTSKVIRALVDLAMLGAAAFGKQMVRRDWDCLYTAVEWLVAAQNPDGSWGGDNGCQASIEETALAVEALSGAIKVNVVGPTLSEPILYGALERGTDWLLTRVESGEWTQPSPIGFYFAKLWYYERLYPMVFTAGALNQVRELGTRRTGSR